MAFSSIDPREMHRLGSGVQNAGRDLADCAAQLRGLMDMLGITHPGVTAIDRAGRWLTDQAPDLYRRRDLAYEAENVDTDVFGNPAAGAVVPPGKVSVDESRLIPPKIRAAAKLAAPLIEAAARGDADARRQLTAHQDRLPDPAFATALLEELGPYALVTLPAEMGRRVRKAIVAGPESVEAMRRENGEVLTMLSQALAAGTGGGGPRVGRRFAEELKRQGRRSIETPGREGIDYPGYWALGQILAMASPTPYSEWFMSTIGRDMIRWDRDYRREHPIMPLIRDSDRYALAAPAGTRPFPGSPDIGAADPIGALMHLAGASRGTAQALLGLKYLLSERRPQWGAGDRGEALGEVLEAAMKGSGETSKRLTVLATQVLADDVRRRVSFDGTGQIQLKDVAELDLMSGMRDNMGRVLAEHADDIVTSYYKNYARLPADEVTGNVDGRPVARFNPADLDLVLLDVAADERAYNALLMGEVAHMRMKVDQAIAARNNDWLNNVIGWNAKAIGHIVGARQHALVARGKEADEADASLSKLVQDGIGLVPLPFAKQAGQLGFKALESLYESFVKDGYAKAGDWLMKQSGHGGGNVAKGYAAGSSNEQAVDNLLKQMLESSMASHGYHDGQGLTGSFVTGDPPRIVPPLQMTRDEYDAFVAWLEIHAKVPSNHTDAEMATRQGMEALKTDLSALGDKK
jgi:hypothetical protein